MTQSATDFTNTGISPEILTSAFDKLRSNPLANAFTTAAQNLSYIAPEPLRVAYNAATMATEMPTDVLSYIKPELQGFADAIKADPALEQAFNDAMKNDPTFLPGIIRMTQNDGGNAFLASLANSLDNDQVRGNFTLALQNLAEREDIDFEDFEKAADALATYDNTMEGRDRVVSGFEGLGLTAESADQILAEGKKDFWNNILRDPERLGGWFGNMAQSLGLPPGLAETLAAVIPSAINMLGDLPQAFSSLMGPDWHNLWENDIKPGMANVQDTGRANMQFANTFG